MVAGAFPLVKLGVLAIRQISKPIANALKERAKQSPFFRTYICMPPAQIYHWVEVNVKMKMLGLGKPSQVQKLNENAAIDLGAELLGEFTIFVIGAGTLTAEYVRQARKSAQEAQALEDRWNSIENRVEELEFTIEKQRTEIRELTRQTYSFQSKTKNLDNNINENNQSGKGLITKAIEDVSEKLSGKK